MLNIGNKKQYITNLTNSLTQPSSPPPPPFFKLSARQKHSEIVAQELELVVGYGFSQNVNNLSTGRHVFDTKMAMQNLLMNKVKIELKMLHPSLLNGVGRRITALRLSPYARGGLERGNRSSVRRDQTQVISATRRANAQYFAFMLERATRGFSLDYEIRLGPRHMQNSYESFQVQIVITELLFNVFYLFFVLLDEHFFMKFQIRYKGLKTFPLRSPPLFRYHLTHVCSSSSPKKKKEQRNPFSNFFVKSISFQNPILFSNTK